MNTRNRKTVLLFTGTLFCCYNQKRVIYLTLWLMLNASYIHKVTYCFTRYRCNILFDIIQQQEKQWERPYTYRHVGVIDLQLLAPQNRCNTFHILIKACELLLFVCFLNIKPIYHIIILNWNVSHHPLKLLIISYQWHSRHNTTYWIFSLPSKRFRKKFFLLSICVIVTRLARLIIFIIIN